MRSTSMPTAAALLMALASLGGGLGCGKVEAEVKPDPTPVTTPSPFVTGAPTVEPFSEPPSGGGEHGVGKLGGGVPEEVADPYSGPLATPPPKVTPAKVTPVKRPPIHPPANTYPMKGGLGVVHPTTPLGAGARLT